MRFVAGPTRSYLLPAASVLLAVSTTGVLWLLQSSTVTRATPIERPGLGVGQEDPLYQVPYNSHFTFTRIPHVMSLVGSLTPTTVDIMRKPSSKSMYATG